ncbi:MAG: diaminopimelate epimerase [Bacteroidia bacterium]
MNLKFSKYHGTGNDFIIIDNRKNIFDPKNLTLVKKLCDRRFGIGADGLILLNDSDKYDFRMDYFNADGNVGSMCGNGGRCIAAFARRLGIINIETAFDAIDGVHHARIEKYYPETMSANVFLKMNDVRKIEHDDDFTFIDTGSPHYVKFVDDPNGLNIIDEGKKIRYGERFRQNGVNVNFISFKDDTLLIRTYERGVEDETLSCGTGAVAAVLAAADKGLLNDKLHCTLITRGGKLVVHFEKLTSGYENIFLEGPAAFVFDGEINI